MAELMQLAGIEGVDDFLRHSTEIAVVLLFKS